VCGRRISTKKENFRYADLRTIQKELYDLRVLRMKPDDYYSVHRSILALSEGGDVSPHKVDKLEKEFARLLKFIRDDKRFGEDGEE